MKFQFVKIHRESNVFEINTKSFHFVACRPKQRVELTQIDSITQLVDTQIIEDIQK